MREWFEVRSVKTYWEGSGRSLFQGATPEFIWTDWGTLLGPQNSRKFDRRVNSTVRHLPQPFCELSGLQTTFIGCKLLTNLKELNNVQPGSVFNDVTETVATSQLQNFQAVHRGRFRVTHFSSTELKITKRYLNTYWSANTSKLCCYLHIILQKCCIKEHKCSSTL